jgi:formylglycine-generating enzyme required for sulfatase activity
VAAYREALAAVPGFAPASAGLEGIEKALLDRATASLAKGEFDAAEADLRRAARVGLDPDAVQDGRAALAQSRSAAAAVAVDEANEAIDRLDLPRAATRLADAQQIDPQAPGLDELSSRLALARRYGHFRPGQRFADALGGGIDGPVMVVVPHGQFSMGAGDDESGARDNERPLHEVRFERGFALAVRETSVGEFARFVAATGYRTVAERRGRSTVYDERGGAMLELRGAHWRRGYQGRTPAAPDDPVIHIAFDDAVAYAEWLSVRTGLRYRLPSEAEFEYALRGGRATPWAWGDRTPARAVANLTGEGDQSPQGRRWGRAIRGWSDGHWGPAPVGTYAPEGFGTYDLAGNVSEWVEDCWHDSYRRAPGDGRAWVNPGCEERVVRGGSWASTLEQSRSAFRLQVPSALTSARIGFRVARDL